MQKGSGKNTKPCWPHANGETSSDRQVKTIDFNNAEKNNMYSGYMYTDNEVHGITNSSLIKSENDSFYEDALTEFSSYMDINSYFCWDRSMLDIVNGAGTGSTTTYYQGYLRVVTSNPSLNCENINDLYSISGATGVIKH